MSLAPKSGIRLACGWISAAILTFAGPALAQPDEDFVEQPDDDVTGDEEGDLEGGVEGDVEGGLDGGADTGAVGGESPLPEDGGTPVATGYDGGFYIKSADGKFALKTQARVQGRYTFESNQDVVADVRDEESNFAVERARLTLGGHAFTEDVKYKFQSDFGKGEVTLKDFYVDWKVSGDAIIRVGQYKRPFSRQQVNSSGNLELVDRAITDQAFNAGRDIGVMLHNNYEESPEIEWAVGVFNATGDGAVPEVEIDPVTGDLIDFGFSNVPALFGPAIVLRGGYNANGIKGYSEADLEGGPLRFGVAGSVLAELDVDDDDASQVLAEVDFVLKQEGLSATGGVYVATTQEDASFLDQTYAQIGFHVQGGYMLTKKHQATVRYALVAPDGGDSTNEVTAGFSLYQFKHGLKWQTDAGLLKTGEANDILARSQLQLSF